MVDSSEGAPVKKRKTGDIHDMIKEKFGRNLHHDEQFSDREYTADETEEGMRNLNNVPESASPYYIEELTHEQEMRLRSIKEMMPKLTVRQQQVMYLCGIKELNLQEAADVMGVTKTAAFQHLRRARKRVQAAHAASEYED